MTTPTITAGVSPSIVDLVGDTPLIRLRRIEQDFPGVELYAKAEWKNPGGSVKDRPALRMIQEGIASGALVPGKVILDATETLPPAQREVLVLRDLEGLPAGDVCNILGLTDTHQRVLLHRARSRVRNALERYYHPGCAAREATT